MSPMFVIEFDFYCLVKIDRKRKVNSADAEKTEKENEPSTDTETDAKENNTGFYDLTAIITHKGRTADSGHYVAWARKDKSKKHGSTNCIVCN